MTDPMFDQLKGKKLYRSPRDGVIFGICSGLAHYLQVDVMFVRLVVIVLGIFAKGWPVILAYAIAVFLIPIDPAQDKVSDVQVPTDVTDRMDSSQNM